MNNKIFYSEILENVIENSIYKINMNSEMVGYISPDSFAIFQTSGEIKCENKISILQNPSPTHKHFIKIKITNYLEYIVGMYEEESSFFNKIFVFFENSVFKSIEGEDTFQYLRNSEYDYIYTFNSILNKNEMKLLKINNAQDLNKFTNEFRKNYNLKIIILI
jgi:hypothetical protein